MPLTSVISPQTQLDAETRAAMFALHARHFDGVTHKRFMADLEEKDWVILIRDQEGSLSGFSTQQLFHTRHAGALHHILFSGDTIVAPAHRNTPLLAGCFGHLMIHLMRKYGEDRLHWLLISKGYRTYRFLPVFFHRYWPAPETVPPPDTAALLHAAARHKFGDSYDANMGIVRIPDGDRLARDEASIPTSRMRDPHVAFFLQRNPGWQNGDELACLAPIQQNNLNGYAIRAIRATPIKWNGN